MREDCMSEASLGYKVRIQTNAGCGGSKLYVISALRKERQGGCCKFEASLDYMVNSRPAWATQYDRVPKIKANQ